jgi:hypothetical protein
MRNSAFSFVVLSIGGAFLAADSGRVFAQDAPENSLSAPMPTEKVPSRPVPSRMFQPKASPAPAFTRPIVDPQVTNQTKQVLGFYGGYAARATLSQQPRRTPIQVSGSRPMFRQAKPFQNVHRDPTVSPYLNLYRDELNSDSAPNYFAFVRPQLEQLEANRMQERDLQQLRGQLQTSGTVVGPQYRASGLPGTGTPARYMDTAQFYSGLRR